MFPSIAPLLLVKPRSPSARSVCRNALDVRPLLDKFLLLRLLLLLLVTPRLIICFSPCPCAIRFCPSPHVG